MINERSYASRARVSVGEVDAMKLEIAELRAALAAEKARADGARESALREVIARIERSTFASPRALINAIEALITPASAPEGERV